MGILFILVVLGLMLWVNYLVAKEFYGVALEKGHPEKKYLWICFFLSAVGYMLVIALPDRRGTAAPANDKLPEL